MKALAAVGLFFLASSASHAGALVFEAPAEPIVIAEPASALAVFDELLLTLTLDIRWAGLSGLTTAAGIHCCTAAPGVGTSASALSPLPGFPLRVAEGSYQVVLDLDDAFTFAPDFLRDFGGSTPQGARSALLSGMTAGTAYFNLFTTEFPDGESRGFFAPVSVAEPGSLALAGLGAILVVAGRRRRGLRPAGARVGA